MKKYRLFDGILVPLEGLPETDIEEFNRHSCAEVGNYVIWGRTADGHPAVHFIKTKTISMLACDPIARECYITVGGERIYINMNFSKNRNIANRLPTLEELIWEAYHKTEITKPTQEAKRVYCTGRGEDFLYINVENPEGNEWKFCLSYQYEKNTFASGSDCRLAFRAGRVSDYFTGVVTQIRSVPTYLSPEEEAQLSETLPAYKALTSLIGSKFESLR